MSLKSNLKFVSLAGALLVAAGALAPAFAQDPDDLKRSVARISLMDGEVSVRRGDTGEWVAGVINAPLLTDDRISTGINSRAELQLDSSNILRIGGNTEIHLAQLESAKYRIEIAKGTATFRVLRPSSVAVELNTFSVSVRPAREGTFRISVSEAGETEVTARVGDVEVFTPKGSQWVYAGQTMMARGSSSDPEFQMVSAIAADDWDRWNEGRDHSLLQNSNSYQYVPQGVYGAEDLDQSGSWTYVAPYGYCWRPTIVAGGWAPYHNGRWVWEDWYGWTWVSYDSWGWAPYHYGRWFFDARLGWNWYPGVLGLRHYWSPALVGFFGYGGGVGVGFGFGNVGWVPLAPYETFHPWWGRGYGGGGFNRNVNITNVNVTNIYRNARVTNGISGVRSDEFGSGRFQNVQRVSGSQVQQAGMITGRMPIAPTTAARRFSDRTVTNVPRPSANTQFYGHSNGAASNAVHPVGNGNGGQGTGNYRRFGEPAATPAASTTRTTQPSNGAVTPHPVGQRFGQPGNNQGAAHDDRQPANSGSTPWKSFGSAGSNTPTRQPYNPPPSRPPTSGQGQQGGRSYTPAYNNNSRPAPSTSTPQRSAPTPSYSAPRVAPAPSSSAPRTPPPSNSGGGRSSGPTGSGGKGHK